MPARRTRCAPSRCSRARRCWARSASAARTHAAFYGAERELLEALGRQGGLALERALLYARQQRANDRLHRLQATTAALARALTPQEVAATAAAQGREALGADSAWVALLDEERRTLELAHAAGHAEDTLQRFQSLPLDARAAARRGRPHHDAAVARERRGDLRAVSALSRGAPAGAVSGAAAARRRRRDAGGDRARVRPAAPLRPARSRLPASAHTPVRAGAGPRAASTRPSTTWPRRSSRRCCRRRSRAPTGWSSPCATCPRRAPPPGGDFYEAVELPGGRLGIAVGDIVGHGSEAAAAMGQLRSALRAYALEGRPPARVLQLLSRYADGVTGARGATVVYAVVDPAARDGALRRRRPPAAAVRGAERPRAVPRGRARRAARPRARPRLRGRDVAGAGGHHARALLRRRDRAARRDAGHRAGADAGSRRRERPARSGGVLHAAARGADDRRAASRRRGADRRSREHAGRGAPAAVVRGTRRPACGGARGDAELARGRGRRRRATPR